MVVKPQLRAISVDFEDQGEIVPARGVTSNNKPLGSCSAIVGPYVSSRLNLAFSSAINVAVTSAKCINSA